MTKEMVPDELWMVIDPLLPPEPPKPNGGRPRVPDRGISPGRSMSSRAVYLGDVTEVTGLRKQGDVLEAAQGLAEGRSVASFAPRTV